MASDEYYKALGALVGAATQLACISATEVVTDDDSFERILAVRNLVDKQLEGWEARVTKAFHQNDKGEPEKPSE